MGGGINRAIVISAGGITAIGVLSAWSQGRGITRVVVGGYLLAVFLSVADMFGGGVSTVAGGLGMLALVAVFLSEGVPLLSSANKLLGGSSSSGGSGSGGSGSGGSGVK